MPFHGLPASADAKRFLRVHTLCALLCLSPASLFQTLQPKTKLMMILFASALSYVLDNISARVYCTRSGLNEKIASVLLDKLGCDIGKIVDTANRNEPWGGVFCQYKKLTGDKLQSNATLTRASSAQVCLFLTSWFFVGITFPSRHCVLCD